MTSRSAATVAVMTLVSFSALVLAAPTLPSTDSGSESIHLVKRKPILKDSDQLSLDHKVPVDAILLVGAGLVAALLCLCVALWNVYAPNASGTRRVREERAQAKTELRLKGGGVGTGTTSPTRVMMEKKRHQSNGTAATDYLSVDSHSKLMNNQPLPGGRFGPKIATNFPRNSRAARGYSSYSKSDFPSLGKNSTSMLAVPTLSSNAAADNASLPGSSTSSGSGSNSHAPYYARPGGLQDRGLSYNSQTSQTRRVSNTLGRGVDLNVNRSRKISTKTIHVNPAAVDPTYSKSSHQANSSDLQDPLAGLELRRFTTDRSDSRESSRRNSSMNALDFFGYGSGGSPIYANRMYHTDSGSDSHSHDAIDGPSTPSALPRTKQMTFYDAEQDAVPSPSLRQDSSLLNTNSLYSSPTKSERKVWGSRF